MVLLLAAVSGGSIVVCRGRPPKNPGRPNETAEAAVDRETRWAPAPLRPGHRGASGDAIVRGRAIERSSRRPLTGAELVLSAGSRLDIKPRRTSKADATGEFVFTELEPGPYELAARSGTLVGSTLVTVTSKQAMTDVVVELDEGLGITGRVKDVGGHPVAGVRLQAVRETDLPAVTVVTGALTDGRYAFMGLLPGSYRITARGPGHNRAGAMVRLSAADARNVDIVLLAAKEVKGRVLTSEGRPVPGARIYAAFDAQNLGSGEDHRPWIGGLGPGWSVHCVRRASRDPQDGSSSSRARYLQPRAPAGRGHRRAGADPRACEGSLHRWHGAHRRGTGGRRSTRVCGPERPSWFSGGDHHRRGGAFCPRGAASRPAHGGCGRRQPFARQFFTEPKSAGGSPRRAGERPRPRGGGREGLDRGRGHQPRWPPGSRRRHLGRARWDGVPCAGHCGRRSRLQRPGWEIHLRPIAQGKLHAPGRPPRLPRGPPQGRCLGAASDEASFPSGCGPFWSGRGSRWAACAPLCDFGGGGSRHAAGTSGRWSAGGAG